MVIPSNVIANADDFGLKSTVNNAIIYCYEQGIINSSSLLINTDFFEEAVELTHQNSAIINVGAHINLVEGRPITDFKEYPYLDSSGNWDFSKVNRKVNVLSSSARSFFMKEILAQVDKALSNKIKLTHIDSHCHIHTLPCFYKIFLEVAKRYRLKIRLAQTYFEGSYLNLYYRKYINSLFKKAGNNYSDFFETPEIFFNSNRPANAGKTAEIMLHPDFDESGALSDHFDNSNFKAWISFLKK